MYARGLNLADTLARPLAWSPARLLTGPERGLLLLPVPGLLFQDAAGLLSAGLPGQPVGLIRRTAGSVDAAQAVSSARPTLGRHPKSGLRNRLLRSEEFALVGAWVNTGFSPNFQPVNGDIWGTAIDADMRNFAVYDRTNSTWIVPTTAYPAGDGRKSVTFTAPAGCVQANVYPARTQSAGKIIYSHAANSVVVPSQTYTFSWHVTGNSLGGVQVETGAVMSPYQRATTAYDVTESGQSDVWYLGFDGIDDLLATPTISWGSDEMTLIAVLNKTGDAGTQMIAEFSTGVATNTGAFSVAPLAEQPGYQIRSKGTATAEAMQASGWSAGSPHLLAMEGKIGSKIARLRLNGTASASTAAGQGSGNYGSHALHIGGRNSGGMGLGGRIYGLLALNRLLSGTALQKAERWMATRCGVTLT